MTFTKEILALVCLISSTLVAQEAKVTQLMSKELTNLPGKNEGPDDVHVVGRNASKTKPAKFVVFLVKDKGAPVLVPAK
jgi:hypothetical protein